MGVLVKGMEMPKPKLADMATVYDAYILVSPNGHAAIVVDNEDGLDSTEYPLVPVPAHGRLIDADALMMDIRKNSVSYFVDDFAHEWVDPQPTIIPAEEDE